MYIVLSLTFRAKCFKNIVFERMSFTRVFAGGDCIRWLCLCFIYQLVQVRIAFSIVMLYDKVNRTCITFNVFFLNAYIMIPNHTGSALSTHTTLFGWVILITMMSLHPD